MKMNEELEQLLKNLKLRRILDIYDEQLRAAEKEDVSYSEFLTRLMRAQWHARQGTPSRMAHPKCQARNAGRWIRFLSRASLASIANRSAPSPNSTS